MGWNTFPGRLTSRAVRPRRLRPRAPTAGFTLLEVMVSLLLVTVGLMGTVAVQQTMFNATSNAGDAAVATRLAMRAMEELDAKTISAGPPVVDQMAAAVTAGWSTPVYEDAQGNAREQQDAQFRFKREVQVTNLGPTFPYNISVRITYALDTGAPKTVRLDAQRWKTW